MNELTLGRTGLKVPQIGLGCMRIAGLELSQGEKLIRTAMENGINFFDHADIYGGGECESFFAKACGMNDSLREKMILQTKCSIRPGVCFDFSKEYILKSVDGSLSRLHTDYVDLLLLHRRRWTVCSRRQAARLCSEKRRRMDSSPLLLLWHGGWDISVFLRSCCASWRSAVRTN